MNHDLHHLTKKELLPSIVLERFSNISRVTRDSKTSQEKSRFIYTQQPKNKKVGLNKIENVKRIRESQKQQRPLKSIFELQAPSLVDIMNITGGFFGKLPTTKQSESLPEISSKMNSILESNYNPYGENLVNIQQSILPTPRTSDLPTFDEKAEVRKSILNKFKNMPVSVAKEDVSSIESGTPTPLRVYPAQTPKGLIASDSLDEWEVNDKKRPVMSIEVIKPEKQPEQIVKKPPVAFKSLQNSQFNSQITFFPEQSRKVKNSSSVVSSYGVSSTLLLQKNHNKILQINHQKKAKNREQKFKDDIGSLKIYYGNLRKNYKKIKGDSIGSLKMLEDVMHSKNPFELSFEKQDIIYEELMKTEFPKAPSKKSLSVSQLSHKESLLGSKNTLPQYYCNYQEFMKEHQDWRKQNRKDLASRGGVCQGLLSRSQGKRNYSLNF